MVDVVDDLLLSASLAAEPDRREPVDLHAVADQAVAAATEHADRLDLTLLGPRTDTPAAGQATTRARTTVLGAPGPLRRVLDALIDNALTHTPPGGTVRVDVIGGADVVVRVIDDGPGIDPDIAPRLFHRFSHAADGPAGRSSFGLGLSLVREIVEAHGGQVTGRNNTGTGATFELTLTSVHNQ
jgi:signal transduction histidine kinase